VTYKGAITSKIKHAIKHAIKTKTSPARLAGLVLSFMACFILFVIAPLPQRDVNTTWLC